MNSVALLGMLRLKNECVPVHSHPLDKHVLHQSHIFSPISLLIFEATGMIKLTLSACRQKLALVHFHSRSQKWLYIKPNELILGQGPKLRPAGRQCD